MCDSIQPGLQLLFLQSQIEARNLKLLAKTAQTFCHNCIKSQRKVLSRNVGGFSSAVKRILWQQNGRQFEARLVERLHHSEMHQAREI